METRKIIQISSANNAQFINTIYALCDDGTLWEKYGNFEWVQVKNVPQEIKEN